MAEIGVVIPAAGEGRRLGGRRKAILALLGEPLLLHALRPFVAIPNVRRIVVALPADLAEDPPAWLSSLDSRVSVVSGGSSRFESVRRALAALDDDVAVAIVHDAARPLVTTEMIGRCLRAVRPGRGAVVGWPSADTLKEVDGEGRVLATPDRTRIWRAQTPQAFPRAELEAAYGRGMVEGERGPTDDAQTFAAAGGEVWMVEGSPWNLKVTHPDDVAVAETLLRSLREASSIADGPGGPAPPGGATFPR